MPGMPVPTTMVVVPAAARSGAAAGGLDVLFAAATGPAAAATMLLFVGIRIHGYQCPSRSGSAAGARLPSAMARRAWRAVACVER